MASREISDLIPELAEKAKQVQLLCQERSVDLLIYCTYRSLEEQAKLYRKSRTLAQIEQKANQFREKGFSFLAEVLMDVGPQAGKLGEHVTNAGPGESWHNFRRAFDSVPLVGGKAMWKSTHEHWQVYGEAVREVSLEWAGDWRRFREFPHAQMASGGNPIRVLSPEEVKNQRRS
jgi:peptidoglycan L-alanyl-D-glutamate endopeptidase CwlK